MLLALLLTLPPGIVIIHKEMRVPAGDTLRGHPKGTVIRASPRFQGPAMLVCERGSTVENITLDGNRARLARRIGLPPSDRDFIGFYDLNGLIADRADGLSVRNVTFRNIANFAAVVARSRGVTFDRVRVEDSGSLQPNGRNNTSGGILIEEGSTDFAVRNSTFLRVRGNAVWTHSRYESPRNGPGVFEHNHFEEIGRDALQAGHATQLRIVNNTGTRVGYPELVVDHEGGGTPVAIDTAGDVDRSVYANNRFSNINGKCIDLDGFHDGEVRDNTCTDSAHYAIVFNNTNPDMQSTGILVTGNTIDGTKYGGIFVIGHGHTISRNRLTRINLAKCGCVYDAAQPDLLRAGIYLGSKAERPAPSRDNTVTDNVVSGYAMEQYCVAGAPGVDLQSQHIKGNDCRNSNP